MAKEYLQVNGQMLMTEDGKLIQVPDSENLNDLADTNGVMATQSEEVTNEIEDLIVNGVIDGSPRGVYDNLSALQTAYPSGANGVYLTSDNGHWYYWNGSAWTDGGVYQGIEISDGSITRKKIDVEVANEIFSKIIPVTGTNIFNKNDVTSGGFLNYTTGNVTSNSAWCYSNYIVIEENTTYYAHKMGGGCQICFYDIYQNFISGALVNSGYGTFTTPSNAFYMRASAKIENLDYCQIHKGNEDILPHESYKFYGYKLKNDLLLSNIKIVSPTGEYGYKSISKAVKEATDETTIFIKNGIYENEVIEAWGKTIHLIGESRNQVIISNTNGDYNTPPLEIGSGTLKNVTIIAYGNDSVTGWTSYAVHVEDNNLFNKKLLIENCKLISYKNAGLGMGTRGGCEVDVRNCDIISKDGASLFFHDSANVTYAGIQNITVANCNIITEGTGIIMKVQSQNVEGSTVNVTFQHNFLRKTTDISSVSVALIDTTDGSWKNTFNELPNFHIDAYSFDNNCDKLNYA